MSADALRVTIAPFKIVDDRFEITVEYNDGKPITGILKRDALDHWWLYHKGGDDIAIGNHRLHWTKALQRALERMEDF